MPPFASIRRILAPRSTRSLLALFVIGTVVPLIVLVVLPLQMATSALSEQSTARVADTSSNAADTLRLQLDSLKALTSSYSQRADIVAATSSATNPTMLRSTMREFQESNPAIKASLLMDGKGSVVSLEPYGAGAVGKDYSFRDYFVGAINADGSFISTLFKTTEANKANYVAISHRVVNASGETVGVLVAAVDSKAVFQTYVDRYKIDHGVDLAIFDQAGQIVASESPSDNIIKTADQHVFSAIAGSPWSGTMKNGDTNVVMGYTSVPGSQWVVSATVPQASAFASIDTLESRVIFTAIVAGCVVLCVICLLARSTRQRDKAEARLRSSDMRTRTILDTAHQMFIELDERGRITDWNNQAESSLGWTREEALGQSIIDMLVPEAQREQYRNELHARLQGADSGTYASRQTNLTKKNSKMPIPVEISSWVTTVEGRRTINLFVQDVSDRLRLQREQEVVVKRQKVLVEELQAADKAKSDFISTISHELRTPLTSITGYLEMLQDGLGGPLNENQQMMIDVVDRNSHRLLALIEDVLTLSRLESGAVHFNHAETEVRALVSAAVETLLPQIHTNGLVLEVDVAYNCGTVTGDINQLERVVLNLLNNAVKFTPEGGRLSVNAYRQDKTVTISVSDTGVGIPIEEQPHLFSRFFRASTAQESAVQGTGLGLTIVKSIVERHGGSVSLQSALGVGTTVYVELPATVNAEATV